MYFIYEVAGYIAGILNACMLIPQVYRSYRNKNDQVSEELSDAFLYLDVFASVCFIVYGIGIYFDTSDPSIYLPILVTAPIGLIWPLALLAIKYNYIGSLRKNKNKYRIALENESII